MYTNVCAGGRRGEWFAYADKSAAKMESIIMLNKGELKIHPLPSHT